MESSSIEVSEESKKGQFILNYFVNSCHSFTKLML